MKSSRLILKSNRPVNLDIATIKLPLTNIVSFAHRLSGMAIFFGTAVLLYVLQISLKSEEDFELALQIMDGPIFSITIWVIVAAILYHLIAGIKHLPLDMGLGETKQGARIGAIVVVTLFLLSISLLSAWL